MKPLLRNAYADGRSIRSAFFAGGAAFALLLPCLAAAQLPDWAPKPPPRVSEDALRAEVLVFTAMR